MTRIEAEQAAARLTTAARKTERHHPGYEAQMLPTRASGSFGWGVMNLHTREFTLR